VISGFYCKVDEICALLGCYARYSGDSLPTLRDSVLVPSPSHRINSIGWHRAYWEPITTHTFPFINHVPKCDQFSSWISWPIIMVLIGCPETLVRNYRYMLHNIPEERRSQSYHFTRIEQKTPDNNDVYRSLENCEPSISNLFHVILLACRIWRWLLKSWKVLHTLCIVEESGLPGCNAVLLG